jgi:hypothetical protein
LELGKTLRDGNNCAIQIRRGDYLNNPYFDIIEWSTYLPRAMAHIGKLAGDVRFMAFSDDPEWCRRNPLLERAIIHDPPCSGIADAMYLMSLCSYHIISNSSYGWWGAYLANSSGGGRVVAPAQWFRGHPTQEAQLCMADWRLI